MKIFEEMKAALEAQAPLVDETEKVKPVPISTDTQNISIQQVPEFTQPRLFQIGDKVSYRTPVIKTAVDYTWAWHHGIVKEISQGLELVIITPRDTPQKWIGVPFVYVRAYEKNEINEFMEVGEHDQEGR
jgi:hypothetical protein